MENTVEHYLQIISSYERQFKKWEGQTDKIIKRYKDEYRNGTRGYTESRFNILWSNVQTAMPAVFSRLPKPDVSRRFKDNDPVGRVASLILERALEFEVDNYPDYRGAMDEAVLDRFLGGRGTAWVRYEPHIVAVPNQMPVDGLSVTEDQDETHEELEYECCPVDYVHWKDFGHNVARTWEEVFVVWRKVYMKRDQLVERFGEELGSKVPLDTAPDDLKKNQALSGTNVESAEALIYEIWDKSTNKAIWISKSLGKVLDERDDPYKLDQFFPCPKPLYATLTNESLEPIPDFKLYQDQANQLDILSDRIDGLIKALQVKGCYDASIPELARLFTEGENNNLMPVKNWTAFAEKAGLQGAISLVDLKPIYEALNAAYQAMTQVQNQVYQITGLSDIIRGQSVASETATAQQLKGQYASLRLKDMQNEVSRFAGDLIKIKAQIMCKLFQPQRLQQFALASELQQVDQQLIPQAIELLKSDISQFRIDIEADSLVEMDEQAEKQSRLEFIQVTSGYIAQVSKVVQENPQIAPLALEMLKFGVSVFKAGKTMEGVIDQAAEQFKQMAQQPKPDPNAAQQQVEQMKLAHDQQLEQVRQQSDLHIAQAKMNMEAQLAQMKAQIQQQSDMQELAHKERLAMLDNQFNRWKAEFDGAVKIETANIASKAKMNDIATMEATQEISREIQ